jgi:hypothetical protein
MKLRAVDALFESLPLKVPLLEFRDDALPLIGLPARSTGMTVHFPLTAVFREKSTSTGSKIIGAVPDARSDPAPAE